MAKEITNILTPVVLALGFVLVAIVLVFMPHPAETPQTIVTGGQGALQNTISVAGNAEISVMPDQAKLYIAIELEEPTARQAQEENARLTNTVRKALLRDFDLEEDDIETSSYNIWPRQEWNPDTRKYEDKGYESRHVLEVTTEEIDKVGEILDVAIQNGATTVQNIRFGMTKDLEADVNDQVLGRAAENAESKAEGLAKTLGVRLGKVVSISESNYYYQPYEYAPRVAMAEMDEMGGYKTTSISPEEVTVSGNVQVAYLIE